MDQIKDDRFAGIAENEISKTEVLDEIKPLVFEKKVMEETDVRAELFADKCYEERLEELEKELNELRSYYRPFLSDHVPQKEAERKRIFIEEFDFRYESEEDRSDFDNVLLGRGQRESLTIPDYRGPTGKWRGFYRSLFRVDGNSGKNYFICFKGADYIANVYLNGRYVGSHTGFFAPFEFDVTNLLRFDSENALVVEICNDAPTIGDGDKIYAATGPGWDEPEIGWHHCPCGAGLFNKVFIEEREQLFFNDVFPRPDIDGSSVEAWVEVYNSGGLPISDGENFLHDDTGFELYISVYPVNFIDKPLTDIKCEVKPAGHGLNYYRLKIPMGEFRLWEQKRPYLYLIRAEICKDGKIFDIFDRRFGMRKIHMEESGDLKGSLFLNNKPIILRGANEMGHLQQCVMKNNEQQLVDDILIAKAANMNYYRITQRPVQEEIYDCFDALGMLQQCDFPLFGYFRRNIFTEAIKQAEEMERLVRSHPSTIMVTYINENLKVDTDPYGHRYLYKHELESFFKAATAAVKLQNPDRIIKNCEGDYDPPTYDGLSDFHCYNMWYTNHAISIGKLHKGFLPAIKKGWRAGCGEYGTEGLDNLHVMTGNYPSKWLPSDLDERWSPNRITMAQSYMMHGDWYEEVYDIRRWIKESQEHQSNATKLMTDALRRRSDIIVSTALHLLIDAWPSGWMKSLVGFDRIPKPAYFTFKDSLIPARVNLKTDKKRYHCKERTAVEVWTLNDTDEDIKGCKVVVSVVKDKKVLGSYEIGTDLSAVSSKYCATAEFIVPEVENRDKLVFYATLYNSDMIPLNSEKLVVEVFPVIEERISISPMDERAKELIQKSGAVSMEDDDTKYYLTCSADGFIENEERLTELAEQGSRIVVMLDGEEDFKWAKDDISVASVSSPRELTFIAEMIKTLLQRNIIRMIFPSGTTVYQTE
jgi:hypothetical protein